jgi:hypothetical protein
MTQPTPGWVRLRGHSARGVLWSASPSGKLSLWVFAIFLGLQFVGRVVLQWISDVAGVTGVVVVVAVCVLAATSAYLYATSGASWPAVDLEAGLLRHGRRIIPFADITDATYAAVPHRGHVDSYLGFGPSVETAAFVCVRSPHLPELDETERDIVAEMLRRSSVRVPKAARDPYDPKGKFAWMDHPNNLSRDEAVDYVLHTPDSGEPRRTPPPPKSIWID